MRAVGGFLAELLGVFALGVFGFFVMLATVAGVLLVWLIGCVSGLFLIIALAESAWWLYTHSHHAAVTALGYYGYAAGTFALIPVLFHLKDKLAAWPEPRRQRSLRADSPGCGWRTASLSNQSLCTARSAEQRWATGSIRPKAAVHSQW